MPVVKYCFDLTRPHTHLIKVELEVPAHVEGQLDLVLPAWLPGAYKIFDNARNIRNFACEDLDGYPVAWERVDWQTWRVNDGGSGARVSYEVFANKPEIHQGQLNAHHAFLNPGVLGLYVDGHKLDWSVELTVKAPVGWRVATALEPTGAMAWRAADYEEFIDCPLQCGHFSFAEFTYDDVRYEIVYEGATPWNPKHIAPALERVVATASDLWGKPPLARYLFMYLETGADYLNGLEHRNCNIITGPVTDPHRLDGLIAMSMHEFFHLWNVKRLRPVGFGPFDYTKEAHTTALWVAEGLTEYYTDLLLMRAGFHAPETYLAGIASYIQQLDNMPGRRNMSIEEASWTTWHFGDDRWNGALNYYVKGYLVGVALDLELRGRSDNQVTLDDVMRAMWDAHGVTGTPYEPKEFCSMAEKLLGESLEDFWIKYLRGKDDFEWAHLLGQAGLELQAREAVPVLQVTPVVAEGGLRLENVLAGGAAQEAGLMIGDVLVAVGDRRATLDLLADLRSHFKANQAVEVAYFRRDRLCTATVKLGAQVRYSILPSPAGTPGQFALRADWLAPLYIQPSFARV
jgi:predicted metalloprotease with PDZ domain